MAARLTAFLVAVIVGISVVAGLIVGAQREADPAVDLLIYNGRVYTGDPAAPMAEAVAVKGNRILRVGTNREIKRLRRNAATVIDAHGGSVLPGFADTYVALPGQADAIAGAHRLGLTSVGAIVDDLAALDGLSDAASTGDHPMRVAAALKVSLPLSEALRTALETRREKEKTTPGLVRLDALAYDVRVPPAKPSRAGARRAPKAALLPIEQQTELLALDRAGWPLVLHVSDEPGLASALDAVAGLIETNEAPAGGRRHRLVLAHPMALDTARLATLGLTVAMPLPATWPAVAVDAPAAVPAASPAAEGAEAPADPAALPFAFPLPAGVQLVMGSEILADPRLGLQLLVSGMAAIPAAGASAEDDHDSPADRTLVASALATLTTGAAQALGAGSEWGTVAPGQLADLVVLSADLFELPAARMLDAVVTATVVDGKVVYDRDTDTPPPPTP